MLESQRRILQAFLRQHEIQEHQFSAVVDVLENLALLDCEQQSPAWADIPELFETEETPPSIL